MDSGLPHEVGILFEAKYDMNCPQCNGAVYVGDPLARVDDEWVCGECHEAASRENRQALRDQIQAQRERDRAEDPERFAKIEAAAKKFTDSVLARRPLDEVLDAADGADMAADPEGTVQAKAAARDWLERAKARGASTPDKEWVALEGGPTPGWVRNPHHEPPPEQDEQMAVEPGIQALMAAGLLSGQEPGGSGVCTAEITAAGKVTEVQIPVPVDPQGPSGGSPEPLEARREELAAAAAVWDPEQIQRDVLQASLQAAVDAGGLTPQAAAGLGWVEPAQLAADDAPGWPDPVTGTVFCPEPGCTWAAGHGGPHHEGPRVTEAREQFRADPDRAPADIFLNALAAATSGPEEQAILDTLDSLPAYVGRDSMEPEKKDLLAVIQGAIDNHPRSLQKKIGPSEIGTECDHCLAAKLAGWDQVEADGAWLPTIGTAVHSWIESAFRAHPDGPGGSRRFLTERRVAVGEIDGEEITGSTDLVDVVAGWTWDWKVVGPTTLKSAKVRPARNYVVQQMLYARGWNRMGVKVTHVGIAYLPRNALSLASSVFWSAPYDEQVALDALERATNMARNIKAMEAVGGAAVRDQYITGLPRWRQYRETVNGTEVTVTGNALEGRIICNDCPRYPDNPNLEQPDPAQLEGLI